MSKNLLNLLYFLFTCSCSFSTLTIKNDSVIRLKQIDFLQLPGWQQDYQSKAILSFINSCNQLAKMPSEKQIGKNIGDIRVIDFDDVCFIAKAIKKTGDKQVRNFFENWFVPFEIFDDNNSNQGLFTGYYVPELRGSRVKDEVYKYPIYGRPKDLTFGPYFTRAEIENGALDGENLELLYVDDKIDLFFMQIQGSGTIILDDGSVTNLSYAGKNNLSYTSIGKHIIKNKIIATGDVSYFSIKNWLKNNPQKADDLMNINKSFVFFIPSKNNNVIGAQGSALIQHRSIAVDTNILPLGVPMWLNVNTPNNPYQKLVVSQDTGSAIKGAIRADIFFGKGNKAENLAARMNYKGSYYILLPAAAIDRISGRI
jgi:membrane-bound lytic murein transglycosylase A